MAAIFLIALAGGIPLLILNGYVASLIASWYLPQLDLSTLEGIGVAFVLSLLHRQHAPKTLETVEDALTFVATGYVSTLMVTVIAAFIYALAR